MKNLNKVDGIYENLGTLDLSDKIKQKYETSEVKESIIKNLAKKYGLFVVIGVLFVSVVYSYLASINNDDRDIIKYKNTIQNLDSSNKISQDKINGYYKEIQREQNNITNRNKLKDSYKKKIDKIINKFDITSLFISKVSADDSINDILDKKIHRFCVSHKLSNEEFWEENMGERCAVILQSIYRFETGNLKSYVGNNIFNFRSPGIKTIRKEKYGVTGVKGGFLVFKDKSNSVKFAVDRFYRIDRYKTIKQIIAGGYYCSPVSGKCFNIPGYTFTGGDCENYISFIKDRYKEKFDKS